MNAAVAFFRKHWFQALVVMVALEAATEVSLRRDSAAAPDISTWFAAPALALVVLPLVFHRRWPFAAAASLWVLAAALSFVDGRLIVFPLSVYATGIVAAFLLGCLSDSSHSRLGLFVVVVGAAVIAYNAPDMGMANRIFLPVMFALPWLAGLALQQRNGRAEAAESNALRLSRDREVAMHAAIADERTRIARELHDVLGHSVSVMTIQASAVRRLLRPEQAKEREALLAVEQTGRDALAEMRRVVGMLRQADAGAELEPQPGVTELPRLVAQTRELGLLADLRVEGEAVPLPSGVDLAVYRLVQEGLTNARKHSDARCAHVRLRYGKDEVEVDVTDDGSGTPQVNEGGQGLIGLRERVSIYDGEFEAGPIERGGWRVRARLPVKA